MTLSSQLDCESPHQLPQSTWESIAWTHLCDVKMHSTPDQNMNGCGTTIPSTDYVR